MKPAALLLGLAAEVAAHGAVTFPPSRNAIDADIYPGNGSRLPNLPIPFEFWCPMPDAAAAAAHGEPPSSGCPHASPPAQSGRAGGGANRPLTTATYAECQKACCADAGCVQWAWDSNLKASARPPQCSGTGGCCWLKSAMGVDKGPCSGAGQAGCVSWSGTSGNHGATPSENKYNLSGANGQACFWFNNGCDLSCDECDGTTGAQAINFHAQFVANSSMPGSWWSGKGIRPNPNVKFPPPHAICKNPKHNATICDPKLRTANVNAECGSNEDFYYYAPWRAPGRSPVIDSCGMAGGRHPGQGHGQAGADYHSTPNAPLGTFGSKLPPRPTGTVWAAGSSVEVGFTVKASHGGGYSYRLCPANETLDEYCFQRTPLRFVGQQSFRWGGAGGQQSWFNGTYVTEGTTPAGSMWSKLPVPRGPWDWDDCIGGMSFEPNCDEDKYNYECAGAFDKPKVEGTMTCICSGRDLPGLEIVDRVLIPADLPAGEWVLGWRWDCEQSTQVWASCSDVTITN